MSDCLVLCFASLESVKVLVLYIVMLKGYGESDQSQEVNDRKNGMKNQAVFSFYFSFFLWSSGSEAVSEEYWTVKQGVLFGCVSLLPLQMYVLLCHLRSSTFLLGMHSGWVFLPLS